MLKLAKRKRSRATLWVMLIFSIFNNQSVQHQIPNSETNEIYIAQKCHQNSSEFRDDLNESPNKRTKCVQSNNSSPIEVSATSSELANSWIHPADRKNLLDTYTLPQYNPINSFYSLTADGPHSQAANPVWFTKQQQQESNPYAGQDEEPLEEVMLQSFGFDGNPIEGVDQDNVGRKTKPSELDPASEQMALNLLDFRRLPGEQVFASPNDRNRRRRRRHRGRPAGKQVRDWSDFGTRKLEQPHRTEVNSKSNSNAIQESPNQSPSPKQALSNERRTLKNKSSIPNPERLAGGPINLGALIKPGQVLLSEKNNNNSGTSKLDSISVQEISDLLRRLKPLEDSKNNRGSNRSSQHKMEQGDSDEDDDRDQTTEAEEIDELRRLNKLERILPTSHLFGGSLGLVNESRINADGSLGEDLLPNYVSEGSASEDLVLLKKLADLHSHLSAKSQQTNSDNKNANNNINVQQEFYNSKVPEKSSPETRPAASPQISSIAASDQVNLDRSIPIETLVDHLMSNSRLASFGIQHEKVALPSQDEEEEEDDEEEEEEDAPEGEQEDEDDQDNNGTLPSEASSDKLDTNESARLEVSYDSVVNGTNSWVPLKGVVRASKQIAEAGKDEKIARKSEKKEEEKKVAGGRSSNLIIGGKKISRTDLIRLIGILNKMANKSEASTRREASRKLLRFLIKLALDDYEQNKRLESMEGENKLNSTSNLIDGSEKSPSEETRGLLRSILLGPVETKSRDGSSIVLKPFQVSKKDSAGNVESETEGEDSQALEEGAKPGTNQTEDDGKVEENKKKRPAALDRLSDDLELYFDSDFFEDLADKHDNSTSLPVSQQVVRGKPRRSSRSSYALPVPIYGHQHIEAADEEDVELDHVRIQRKPRRRTRGGKKVRPGGKGSGRRSRSGAARRASSQKVERDEIDDEGDELDQPDNVKEEEEAEVEESPRQVSNSRRVSKRKRDRPISSKSKKRPRDGQDRAAGEEDSEEDGEDYGEPEREGESTARQEKIKQAEKASPTIDDAEVEKSDQAEGLKRRPQRRSNRGTKKRKRRKRRKRRRRRKGGGHEIDLDKRDEIPAPIVATKFRPQNGSSRLKGEGNKKSAVTKAANQMQRLPRAEESESAEIKKKKMKPAVRNQVKRREAKKSAPRDPGEEDYYNEGTSYAKICDDDGGCKVTVESSSPKLSKAIKARDKPAIEKHLARWASEE